MSDEGKLRKLMAANWVGASDLELQALLLKLMMRVSTLEDKVAQLEAWTMCPAEAPPSASPPIKSPSTGSTPTQKT